MQQRLPGLVADITRTRVIHKLPPQAAQLDDKPLELQQREIVSHSPVSMVAPYHTALIVIAAASAFVISVLTVLVILYRRKVSEKVCMCKSLYYYCFFFLKMNSVNQEKMLQDNQFVSSTRPIYIELPNEKYQAIATDPTTKK